MGWEYLVYAVVSAVMSYGLQMIAAPKAETPTAGQMDIPLTEQGTPILVCFGTNLIKQTTIAWYGDASTEPVKAKGGK